MKNLKDYKQVYINPDRTPLQQMLHKKLLQELKSRKEAREDAIIYRERESNFTRIVDKFSRRFLSVPPPESKPTTLFLPSLLLANVCSVLPKIDHFRSTISFTDTKIFNATESWLHDGITDDLLHINNRVLYRDDRRERRGGGVCLWISHCVSSTQIFVRSPNYITSLWFSLHEPRSS